MKNILSSILLCAVMCIVLHSCSTGGAYDANPSSPANQSINPLDPLKANQFTWSGSGHFSANVNGSQWVSDTAWIYLDTAGEGNLIAIQNNNSSIFLIHYPNSWGGNLYNMGYQQPRYALYADSVGGTYKTYYSYLGNSGEFNVTKSVPDTLIGKFYFQAVSPDSGLVNITNGYINIQQ